MPIEIKDKLVVYRRKQILFLRIFYKSYKMIRYLYMIDSFPVL